MDALFFRALLPANLRRQTIVLWLYKLRFFSLVVFLATILEMHAPPNVTGEVTGTAVLAWLSSVPSPVIPETRRQSAFSL